MQTTNFVIIQNLCDGEDLQADKDRILTAAVIVPG